MAGNELHIYLTVENKDKLLRIGNTLDKSATKLVNSIISDMSNQEIEDRILRILQKDIGLTRDSKIKLDEGK